MAQKIKTREGKIHRSFDDAIDALPSEKDNTQQMRARPFIKWVGGKASILSEIKKHLPQKIKNYYEPFLGGGSVFFGIDYAIKNAFLSDLNLELALTYQVIKKNITPLIELLRGHQEDHCKEYYYKIRENYNKKRKEPIKIASQFIYLNKTGYNGLYRVNRKNDFNVPLGSYTNPTICDEANLRNCHEVLQNVEIQPVPFADIKVKDNSIIYCDPPYHGVYNQYQAHVFDETMQGKLAQYAKDWYNNGCKVIISNSDTEYIRELYKCKPFTIHEIEAPRSVSCKNESRGMATELLITTK